jgi:hypothetical protein
MAIEYKKILHYVMLFKSVIDTSDTNPALSELCMSRIRGMRDYLNDEEKMFLVDRHFPSPYALDKQSAQCRNIIDEVFKIMGIYKEPFYVVEE